MAEFKPGDRMKHHKRGSTYTIIGPARLQTNDDLGDMTDLILYRCEHDGTLVELVA